ncbi:GINS complex, Psf1 component [Sistotremastrum suecicum HHB10207 ss-3]|uniref:DNA replication complex GINS protein PSF1 n=1 Tax=Sistotremastrum suecicum HHB10207 ss-3 TaxID=1314776 RepID=A0A165ZLU8_9AGAM|nr:GINS complex, Psf1 component [Sistotremastrum suecicum HHB10207 ss-3]
MSSSTELSVQLITECKRSSNSGTLYKYNDNLVRQLSREIRVLDRDLTALLSSVSHLPANEIPHPELCALTMIQTTIERDKRCLLAYHQFRMSMLKDMYWAVGGALPHVLNDPDVRGKLSPHEVDFMREYARITMEYRSDLSDVVDITMGIITPPKDIHALVIVVRDCGVVTTELGAIDFQKGQRYLVRRADIEHLILQGYLEEV